MESSEYTERTLDLVPDLHARYGAVGVVIQAYLYRSQEDVENLCERRIRVRLCKGRVPGARRAWHSSGRPTWTAITCELMKLLLEKGEYPAIATHDEKIIEQTKAFAALRKLPRDAFEFQMLYGIRRDLQRRLVAEGYRLRLYVPFGRAWYPYYMRRLAERPANVLFMLRNLFRKLIARYDPCFGNYRRAWRIQVVCGTGPISPRSWPAAGAVLYGLLSRSELSFFPPLPKDAHASGDSGQRQASICSATWC